MLRSARTHVFSLPALLFLTSRPVSAEQFHLTLPHIDWAVSLELDGFTVDYQELQYDMVGRSFQASDSVSGLTVSVHFDPIGDVISVVDHRDRWLTNLKDGSGLKFDSVKVYERDSVAYFSYIASIPDGSPELAQRSLFASMIKDSLTIGIHLSKVTPAPEDDSLFEAFLDGVKFVEEYEPSAIERYVFGSRYYGAGKHRHAVEHLQRALDLDRVEPSLPGSLAIDLVDKLSESYRLLSRWESMKEVLAYGLILSPNDPLTRYNLARYYAEANNLELVVEHLRDAFARQNDLPEGKTLSHPMKAVAFKQYREDERFLNLVQQLDIRTQSESFTFTLPDLSVGLRFTLENPQVELNQLKENLEGLTFQANDLSSGLTVAVFFAPEEKRGGLEKLKEFLWKGIERRAYGDTIIGIEESVRDSVGHMSYSVRREEKHDALEAHNRWVMLVRDRTWVSVRLSVLGDERIAETIFDDFLQGMELMEPYSFTSFDNMKFGTYYYFRDKYKKACEYYQAALDQEVVERVLSDDLWRAMVDNLGMSYGFRKKYDQARETFEYGISQFPNYPNFHYNLACTYAEQRDLDNALLCLEQALVNVDNRIEGEDFPDALEDPSFKRWRKNKRLIELVEKYEK